MNVAHTLARVVAAVALGTSTMLAGSGGGEPVALQSGAAAIAVHPSMVHRAVVTGHTASWSQVFAGAKW